MLLFEKYLSTALALLILVPLQVSTAPATIKTYAANGTYLFELGPTDYVTPDAVIDHYIIGDGPEIIDMWTPFAEGGGVDEV